MRPEGSARTGAERADSDEKKSLAGLSGRLSLLPFYPELCRPVGPRFRPVVDSGDPSSPSASRFKLGMARLTLRRAVGNLGGPL